ncbi:ABC transporter ATP-binding protein [Bordetella holmesii]|uniref:ABC transporter, ATP-binding protein n=2 Tax=Bordetella holmesii TaxID=35814 RepID=A0A158M322_9BORD|nr:ATP-binding cassette domain-containing protein [Bordetella holmesii]AHV92278.1 ABC transporter family protein [Bordetella holmesii ATCC 51541]AIT28388.1 ABC transporter family protein [Bordetella holmesii 44057]EWM41177.1 ABC transporter family protein [Bordetella holmesii 35009]EWM42457.1 ABC transporter family protein [Bordetella holmesii 41130]EWM45069.1 ABC transporter family protein [Bordetella holmesii 70147]KAK87907.1 ABC transporter, ATP-binding protein [Bordetella holmesii CDC-H57
MPARCGACRFRAGGPLELQRGECIAIMGESGAGKSLFLRQIADLDPGVGEIWLDGVAPSSMRGPAWRRLVRYCQAEAGWWDDAVAEHFSGPAAQTDAVPALLEALGLRANIMQSQVSDLSTGERQRLALLRALRDQPAVMLLDEPTASLDESATERVERLIRRLLAQGTTALMVTHNPAQAQRLAGRCYRVHDRRLQRL